MYLDVSSVGKGISNIALPGFIIPVTHRHRPLRFWNLVHDSFQRWSLGLTVNRASAKLRGESWSPPGQKQKHMWFYGLWDPIQVHLVSSQ